MPLPTSEYTSNSLPADLENAPCRVAVCLTTGMSLSSTLIACAALKATNDVLGREAYVTAFVGQGDDPVASGIGIGLTPTTAFTDTSFFDLVVVVSAREQSPAYMSELWRFLRFQARNGAELCGVDMGVAILAEAGLLSGYRAAVHWEALDALSNRFPDIEFCDDIYVLDRDRSSCGGHISCSDLFLSLIERDHGLSVSQAVAEQIVAAAPRPAVTRQSNPLSWDPTISNTMLRHTIDIMQENLEEPLSIPAIADQVGISVRQLQNLSRQHFGETLSERYLAIRLNTARCMLMYGDASITEIVVATGFSSSAVFARAFRKQFNLSASQYRSEFQRSFSRPYFVARD